jgi:hypothetical protein
VVQENLDQIRLLEEEDHIKESFTEEIKGVLTNT